MDRSPLQPPMLRASIIIILTLASLAGCAPLYTPNPIHTTLDRLPGTVEGTVHVGTSGYNGAIEITPVRHLTLLGAISYEPWWYKPKQWSDSMAGHMEHRFLEGGLGYSWYGSWAGLLVTHDLIATYGVGRATALWPNDSAAFISFLPNLNGIYRVDGEYRRVVLQYNSAIGGTGIDYPGKNALGLALRGSYVWFDEVRREDRSTLHPRALFIDPVIFARKDFDHFSFELQFGLSVKVPLSDEQLRYSLPFFAIGGRARIEELW